MPNAACPARDLFPVLTAHDCARCSLVPVRITKGHRLPAFMDEPGALSFVADGTVVRARHLDDAPPVVFDVVRAGGAFASRPFVADTQRSDSEDDTRAVEASQLCFASRDVLLEALGREPRAASLVLAVYERMADRIAAWSTARAIPGARERIETTLGLLGGQRPRWASLGALADITGLRRETVCRALRPRPLPHAPERAPCAESQRPTA